MSVPFYNLLFNLTLEPEGPEPLYLQVSSRVAEVIREGKLQPGSPMPGTRTLAKALGISRNAAIAAYGELHAQGWIQTEVGFGTRVALALPEFGQSTPGPGPATTCGFAFTSNGEAPKSPANHRVDLRDALPDPRLLPEEELARAFRRPVTKACQRRPMARDPHGLLEARECLADLLAERRALAVKAQHLLLTGGRLDALGLIARNLFPPGAAIAVEDPGDPQAWSVLQQGGMELVPVAVDADGLVPEALEDACVARRPSALYLTPGAQRPTGAVLTAERRAAVLELAGRYRMAVLEDDHAAELYYQERDWRPLAAEDRRGVVLHIGSFEHLFGPAFAIAFIAGPEEPLATLARARQEEGGGAVDLLAGALRDLIVDGIYLRHVRKVRTAYRQRRDLVIDFLREAFQERLQAAPAASGLNLWVTSRTLDLDAIQGGAARLGLGLRPTSHWRLGPDGTLGLMLPFASLDPGELALTLPLLKRAAPVRA